MWNKTRMDWILLTIFIDIKFSLSDTLTIKLILITKSEDFHIIK